jgi:uncharacterized protein with HEPN domain
MPSRSWLLRVEDMLEALKRITQYCEGHDFQSFAHDQRTIDAVVRNLEVFGEAARHVPASTIQAYPFIPWQLIKGMRNILIHEYFGVDNKILWHTIIQDLPPLKSLLAQILEEHIS